METPNHPGKSFLIIFSSIIHDELKGLKAGIQALLQSSYRFVRIAALFGNHGDAQCRTTGTFGIRFGWALYSKRSWRQGTVERIQGGNARQAVVILVVVVVVYNRLGTPEIDKYGLLRF